MITGPLPKFHEPRDILVFGSYSFHLGPGPPVSDANLATGYVATGYVATGTEATCHLSKSST